MHSLLAKFHPKRVKNDIGQVNNFICSAVKTLCSTSLTTTTLTDTEIPDFQFCMYKKIKAPVEWITKILYLNAAISANPTDSPDTLYNEMLSLYQCLNDLGIWHPSNHSPEEQVVAIVAKQKEEKSTNQSFTKMAKKKRKKR